MNQKSSGEVCLSETLRLNYPNPVIGNRIWIRKFPLKNSIQQPLEFSLTTSPLCYQSRFADRFGNKVLLLSRTPAHSLLEVQIKARISLSDYPKKNAEEVRDSISEWTQEAKHSRPLGQKKIPCELENFREGSGKVILNSVTKKIAQTLQRQCRDEWGATVLRIRNWVHQQMKYKAGVTETHTDSFTALRIREGVCQDITHVFLSLVRSLGIPARYLGGYQVGGTEMHSWAEVYFPSGEWLVFDPTESSDHLPKFAVACGRDYLDCSAIQGNFRSASGNGKLSSAIKVQWLKDEKAMAPQRAPI